MCAGMYAYLIAIAIKPLARACVCVCCEIFEHGACVHMCVRVSVRKKDYHIAVANKPLARACMCVVKFLFFSMRECVRARARVSR